jgi:hypothetical protein
LQSSPHGHDSPHGHGSPHEQPTLRVTVSFWQPQGQAVPAQLLQLQWIAVFLDISTLL